VPQVVVGSTRAAMGPVAAAFHGFPSRRLDLVGVTGTNGKTTTCHLLEAVFTAAGRRAAVIGTLTGARTTPEAPELQEQLARMVSDGIRSVAMEVSSHALALHRVDGTAYTVAVFTNLGRDHLDFHRDVDDYFEAKARLFTAVFTRQAVIAVDSEPGQILAERAAQAGLAVEGYTLDDVEGLTVGIASSCFRWQGVDVAVPLGGRFNAANALAAATAARVLGLDPATIAAGIAAAPPVPGRFEAVDAGQPFAVIVDYAHTPDGLEEVLGAARDAAQGHDVIAVFGCGGDRDRAKRPLMGAVAARLADAVVITSDNPRSEDPAAIISDVLAGIADQRHVVVEADRRRAIATAVVAARPGDVVVVAGKGHETVQVIGDREYPFDDRVVVREELARR
jgi:UDP-N-acetylmuramoyl-L-alanyl-D-glutamate--2,6-diaminopimelate ligase